MTSRLKQIETDFFTPGIDDQAATVRQEVRSCFKIYMNEYQVNAERFIQSLRSIGKKQLMIELKDFKPS